MAKKTYPASKSIEVPDHLALRATWTFLGLLFAAETECPERQIEKATAITTQNPNLKRVSIVES